MMKLGWIAGLALTLVGCVDDGMDGQDGQNGQNGAEGDDGANGADGHEGADGVDGTPGPAGPQVALPALYTLGNGTTGNAVAGYLRGNNGNLTRNGTYATTGMGTGAGLGSQGAIEFDSHSQRFFVVNAGDDSISMLALDADGELTPLAKVASGGKRPVSIAVHGDVVYVSNQGDVAATQ